MLGSKAVLCGESGMCAEILFRTSLSSLFAGVQSSAIGLYEAGSVGGLSGFRMEIILTSFQVLGMLLLMSE